MTDPFRIKRIAQKLETAWSLQPHLRFGQLLEQIEDLGWQRYYDSYPHRHFSARLMNLDDQSFELGLNQWIKNHSTTP